uniref:SH2 domain-containing protein n=1 Tax=Trichuris muris TaxID=70415 RepID=A0A5S6QG39_TRIMR
MVLHTDNIIVQRIQLKNIDYDNLPTDYPDEPCPPTQKAAGVSSRIKVPWNENSVSKEELMLHGFAVRPLCKLPYYHGCNKLENLSNLPTTRGEYLIFLNSEAEYEVTLLVCDDEGIVNSITVESDKNGYFWLRKSDLKYCFTSIDKLMKHYQNGQIPIKGLTKKNTVLLRPLVDPEIQKGLMVEQSANIETWPYFVSCSKEAEYLHKHLKANGDYLLCGDPKEDNLKTVLVKWGNTFTEFCLEQNKKTRRWKLPRSQLEEPEETVSTIDQVLKSLSRIKDASNGFMLLRPVQVNCKTKSTICRPRVQHIVPGRLPCDEADQLISGKAPRPLHSLPYYYGKISAKVAEKHLKHCGDYLVYLDENSGVPTIPVCLEVSKPLKCVHVPIKCNEDGYFYIQPYDVKRKLSTVEELLEYYKRLHLPIEVHDEATASVHCGYLKNEMLNLNYFKNYHVLNKDDVTKMECFHGNLAKEDAHQKLNRSGDYLLRWDKQGERIAISAFWDGHHYDIIVTSNESKQKGYVLPKEDECEPTEYVRSLAEFLRSAVLCEFQFHEVVLKCPILCPISGMDNSP